MGRPPRISRDELLDTARRIFAAKGFEGATLADIATELRVTPAAVLRYVESKQDLFRVAMRARITAPPEFILELAHVDARTDPRVVLRGIAERFIPFAEKVVAENIAIYMHDRARSLVVPFDPSDADSPPRRGLVIVSDYFRRAMEAGVVRAGDPKAAALLFMGSLQAYVMLHRVLNALPKPYPLDRYIDALIDLWSNGAIVGGHRGKTGKSPRASRSTDPDRRRHHRHAVVHAREAGAEGADGIRHAGGKDSQRRIARRRPRHPRSGG
jgi:AcrR family transcriptional regulator